MKNGKAASIDNNIPKVIKTDPEFTAVILKPFLAVIWEDEQISEEWKKGVLIKV